MEAPQDPKECYNFNNEAAHVPDIIHSVVAIHYPGPYEVLAIDDGSTYLAASTLHIAQQTYPVLRVIALSQTHTPR